MSSRDILWVATPMTPGRLKRQVAAEFGFIASDLEGNSKTADVVVARDAAIARMHEAFPAMSLPAIARQFGERDHTTILHSLRKSKAGRYSNGTEKRVFTGKPFPRDEARRRYLEDFESMQGIAASYGVRKERVRLCFDESEIRRCGVGNRRVPVPPVDPKAPPQPNPHKALSPAEAGIWHLIDLKRAGHTTAEYRARCEISELEDMRERRALGRQPRVTIARGQEGSWIGSPAELCAV